MIQHVTIIGVGLIGGSLGLVWKKNRPDLTITGVDAPEVLARALERGAVGRTQSSVEAAVRQADVVVLAVPLLRMPALTAEAAACMKPGAILTDVGSVKSPQAALASSSLPAHVTYIGGHPMAGSERGGIDHADAFLFENATYVLCPAEGKPVASIEDREDFIDLIRSTGGRLLLMDAARHDRIAAVVSHLPQLAAVALMNTAAARNGEDDAFLRLAAGGFRDMTRIASSPFSIWRDILSSNRDHVLAALDDLTHRLSAMRTRLAGEGSAPLEALFEEARQVRDTIPRNSKGFLLPLSDIYVYAEDQPGELLSIAQALLASEINIKDIELLKIREGTGGAFRMSFSGEAVAESAVRVLQRAGYTAYRL